MLKIQRFYHTEIENSHFVKKSYNFVTAEGLKMLFLLRKSVLRSFV